MIFPGKRATRIPSPGIIRRFSPDGRLLCVFAPDQQTVLLYGVQARRCRVPRLFEDFFSLAASIRIPLAFENELLCREFMLFGEERRDHSSSNASSSGFIILASAAPSNSTAGSKLANPRSFTTFEQLDDVCFHLLSLADHQVKDRLELQSDYILLANHSGVSLLDDYFLVTSLQNQCIAVYRIVDLKFVPVTTIGHHLGLARPQGECSLVCGLWHKILVNGYEHAADKGWFHGACNSLRQLVISKAQFVDTTQPRVLIRMVPREFMAQRLAPSEHPSQYFFVVFDCKHNRVEDVLHYSKFLEWLVEHDYLLKRTAYESTARPDNNPSYTDCPHTLHSLTRHIEPVSGVKRTNVLKRLLYSFPYSSQVLSTCKYLSQQHFRFDDKLVGRECKWRISPDYPVRFILKDDGGDDDAMLSSTERFAFSIEPWADQPVLSGSNFKRFHNATWHPQLPLVILTYQSALRSASIDIYYC